MKNKIKSILLTSLAILSLWGMTYTTKQLHALTYQEFKSYMNEYKAGNYGENQIFLSADGNFVIYTKDRTHQVQYIPSLVMKSQNFRTKMVK